MGIIEIGHTKRCHLEIHPSASNVPTVKKGRAHRSRTNPNRHVKLQVISKSLSGSHLTHGGVQKSFENLVEGFAPIAFWLTAAAMVIYSDGVLNSQIVTS